MGLARPLFHAVTDSGVIDDRPRYTQIFFCQWAPCLVWPELYGLQFDIASTESSSSADTGECIFYPARIAEFTATIVLCLQDRGAETVGGHRLKVYRNTF